LLIRDIRNSTTLPMMGDANDGYGDVKNVVHTVQTYAQMGIEAIFMEDQQSPKRCGHLAGKSVVPTEVMEAKLRAAVGERGVDGPYIVARTDAGAVLGMDEALRRGDPRRQYGGDPSHRVGNSRRRYPPSQQDASR
jgi:2-methylisocitrate lyase-like PEP mutase family enzyme